MLRIVSTMHCNANNKKVAKTTLNSCLINTFQTDGNYASNRRWNLNLQMLRVTMSMTIVYLIYLSHAGIAKTPAK